MLGVLCVLFVFWFCCGVEFCGLRVVFFVAAFSMNDSSDCGEAGWISALFLCTVHSFPSLSSFLLRQNVFLFCFGCTWWRWESCMTRSHARTHTHSLTHSHHDHHLPNHQTHPTTQPPNHSPKQKKKKKKKTATKKTEHQNTKTPKHQNNKTPKQQNTKTNERMMDDG